MTSRSQPPSKEKLPVSKDTVEHFLITYNIANGIAHVDPYGSDYEAALSAYDAAEELARNNENLDIVLVGAENLEVVKRTHSSYFETKESLESLLPEGFIS